MFDSARLMNPVLTPGFDPFLAPSFQFVFGGGEDVRFTGSRGEGADASLCRDRDAGVAPLFHDCEGLLLPRADQLDRPAHRGA